MDTTTLAKGLAANRLLMGSAMLLDPERGVRGWIGSRAARNDGAQLVTRGLGARDVALAAGALLCFRDGEARQWVAGMALADAADFAATLLADDIPAPSRAFGLAMAGASTAVALAYVATHREAGV
jgi:hypothetical protein